MASIRKIMKKFNVLLVEDDDVDTMTVERAFSKANILNPLFTAKNGIEALDLLRGTNGKTAIKRPVVVLLDLNMPKMNGLEFLEEIRKDNVLKRISVVVLTSSSDDKDIWKAYEKNVSGYMTKPVNIDQFVEKMAVLGHYWSLCELTNGVT